MRFSVETITPSMALKYLDTNLKSQRNMSDAHVGKLAKMMVAGEFDGENGQTIKFNGSKGNESLIDGQHRLRAIIKSGKPVKIGVARGCSSDAFKTIDNIQNARSIANYYEISGQPYSKVAAQVARWVYRYEKFNRTVIGPLDKTPGHIADWAQKNHPDIPERVGEIEKHLREFNIAKLGTKPYLAFFYYLASRIDRVLAYRLTEYIGSNTGNASVAMANAKQVLMELAAKQGNPNTKLAGNPRMASVISVLFALWNVERTNGRKRSKASFKKVAKMAVGAGTLHHTNNVPPFDELL